MFSIALYHRMSERTTSAIIKSTCAAIVASLSDIYLRPPNKVVWRNIAEGFKIFGIFQIT